MGTCGEDGCPAGGSTFPAPLFPGPGGLREARALHADDAEALAGGRAHDDPTLHALVDCRAQLLEARDFGGDVVGFDVDVHAAFMADALDLNAEFAWPILEHPVVAA